MIADKIRCENVEHRNQLSISVAYVLELTPKINSIDSRCRLSLNKETSPDMC